MEYIVEYSTHNNYEQEVKKGHFELMVNPCSSPYQTIKEIDIQHNLKGSAFYGRTCFDFESLHIHTENQFQNFDFKLRAKVEKTTPDFLISDNKSPQEERTYLENEQFRIEQAPFLRTSGLTFLNSEDIPANLWKSQQETVGTYLVRLNTEIRQHMEYKSGVTTPETTARQALKLGAGVCQDFSHVMLGILRKQGIPARYVSGYLNANSKTGAQLHAWVEAYIPFMEWKGFDPTNQLMEDENYIKIAHGKDYSDCKPIKGVLQTEGRNKTEYSIRVMACLSQQQ